MASDTMIGILKPVLCTVIRETICEPLKVHFLLWGGTRWAAWRRAAFTPAEPSTSSRGSRATRAGQSGVNKSWRQQLYVSPPPTALMSNIEIQWMWSQDFIYLSYILNSHIVTNIKYQVCYVFRWPPIRWPGGRDTPPRVAHGGSHQGARGEEQWHDDQWLDDQWHDDQWHDDQWHDDQWHDDQ